MDLFVEIERGYEEKYSMALVNNPNPILPLLIHYQLFELVGQLS